MVRRRWNRRRGDNRVATKDNYAPIQDAAEAFGIDLGEEAFALDTDQYDDDPQDLTIPDFREALKQAELNQDDIVTESSPPDQENLNSPDMTDNRPASRQSDIDGSRIFAFCGATGGVGTTSLATQTAYELAMSLAEANHRNRPNDPRVCLIDLDFESGACAHHLDLLPSLTIEDLSGPASQIDTAFTAALVSTHSSGVSLLATPNMLGANAKINPLTVMAMLDAAAELYDYVIIDIPRYLQPWSLGVMRAVDVMNLVCELTIPSLHAGRERLAQIRQYTDGTVNAKIVLSKYERRSFRNTLKLSDAETALGCEIFATICQDPDATREALNCGEPAGAVRADTRFVKDVRKLCRALQKQAVNPIAQVA